jgi:tRNA threonylcarbamoyl adenosine modification protein (Sua5/YciO/YrdC/YwlC family)
VILEINPVYPQPRRIARAVEVLRRGGLIAYPTDTVYAIGGALAEPRAVKAIQRWKALGGSTTPPSIIADDISTVASLAAVDNEAYKLIRRLTPGPYTFILPAARLVPRKLLARTGRSVGVRLPAAPVVQALVAALGGPLLTATAKGPDGELLATPREVESAAKGFADLVLDAGPIEPVPSTVIDLTGETPIVLRQGRGEIEWDEWGVLAS